jgi:hypothetical protein
MRFITQKLHCGDTLRESLEPLIQEVSAVPDTQPWPRNIHTPHQIPYFTTKLHTINLLQQRWGI